MACAQLGWATAAHAATGLALMPGSLLIAGMGLPGACAAPVQPAMGLAAPQAANGFSKTQAILGGQVSRLEAIALQQTGAAAMPSTPAGLAQSAPLPGTALTPGAGGVPCPQLVRPASQHFQFQTGFQPKRLTSENFLASKRLPVTRTAFDPQWRRVSHGGVSRGLATAIAGNTTGGTAAKLAAVNSWTNARIRYVEDQSLYGKADYWAGAQTTLRRRAGDCEDIAIAKMHLLAALGVARSDMYLTIARDLSRNTDHALLVVKQDGNYWLLDNATDRLLDASQSHDYRPILSYSAGGKWLHGY